MSINIQNISDSDLLELLKARDRRAWNMVYQKYGNMLKTHILSNSGNEDEALDMMQETFAVLSVKLQDENFVLTSRLGTFLYSIIRFKWLARLKLRGKMPTMSIDNEEFELADNTNSEEVIARECKLKHIEYQLTQLKTRCQEIIKKYYYKSLSMKEIAAELGYTDGKNVKNQKARCMKVLIEMVKSNENKVLNYE